MSSLLRFRAACRAVVAAALLLLASLSDRALKSETKSSSKPAIQHSRASAIVAGLGSPWLGLTNEEDVISHYTSSDGLPVSLERGRDRPLSLAAGDFDEDGVSDVVAGYVRGEEGLLALHRGNVRAIYIYCDAPMSRCAPGIPTTEPFLRAARVFDLSVAPELLGVGDWDGDGHLDLVATRVGASVLHLLRGNGGGEFPSVERIPVSGTITAMLAGEFNRPDGLADLLVGVVEPRGPRLLIYEWPDGALRGTPEELPLPEPVTALALGRFDGGPFIDLAVAAGHELLFVQGRDRRLSLGEDHRHAVRSATIDRMILPLPITSMTVGHFSGIGNVELAALFEDGLLGVASIAALRTASLKGVDPRSTMLHLQGARGRRSLIASVNVSSRAHDDLLVVDREGRRIRVVSPISTLSSGAGDGLRRPALSPEVSSLIVDLDLADEVVALQALRLNGDALDDLVILRSDETTPSVVASTPIVTYVVNSTADPGNGICDATECTLREAIVAANRSSGGDLIAFNIPGIPGPLPRPIQPQTPLPPITDPVTVDGRTQPGASGGPVIVLDGIRLTEPSDGLAILSNDSTARGLVIHRFPGFTCGRGGIRVAGRSNIVEGNFVGTDVTGRIGLGNGDSGITIGVLANNNLVGGTVPEARNVIAQSRCSGVLLDIAAFLNRVRGNFIGTDAAGTGRLGNTGDGVFVDGENNTIGEATIGGGNLISGNGGNGINFSFEFRPLGNRIFGNLIGTDVTGAAALSNGWNGIQLNSADETQIGATSPLARNVIAGNRLAGILADGDGALIQGNYIGTNAAASAALRNGTSGILGQFGTNVTIGGSFTPARNIISGNGGDGVLLTAALGSYNVQGNYIGIDGRGATRIPNGTSGISVNAGSHIIGGVTPGGRNVISGNRSAGIHVAGVQAEGNVVRGNFIGLDATGSVALGNGFEGIFLDGAPNNRIGGTSFGERNVISGNGTGIRIRGSGATGNLVRGNFIGTDWSGSIVVGNGGVGVLVEHAPGNQIGGTTADDRNIISGNVEGVLLFGSGASSNMVQGNYIGTDRFGTVALGNRVGVVVDRAPNNTIGGAPTAGRNLIGGSTGVGVLITNTGATNNQVLGNFIGTLVGDIRFGNGSHGVSIVGADNNLVGGVMPGDGNTISQNGARGVFIASGTGNGVRRNSIFLNGGLGIDLGPLGVTNNDPGDIDTGANQLQNFPVVNSATCGAGITVEGTLNSTPMGKFALEFFSSDACDPSGHGEGENFLGSLPSVLTGGLGDASFSTTLFGRAGLGDFVTATATSSEDGNSSEFSACVAITGTLPPAVTGVSWDPGDTTLLRWLPVAGASYRVYKGVRANLTNLTDPRIDSCLRKLTTTASTGPVLTEVPPLGQLFWYMVRAVNSCGEGTAGSYRIGGANLRPRIHDSIGDCSPLAHDTCTIGGPLDPSCDECVARICNGPNPSCCTTLWDSKCVENVLSVCGSLACPGSTPGCQHSLCSLGSSLVPGCDAPPLEPSCVKKICELDPHCCTTVWDDACIVGVHTVCNLNCL